MAEHQTADWRPDFRPDDPAWIDARFKAVTGALDRFMQDRASRADVYLLGDIYFGIMRLAPKADKEMGSRQEILRRRRAKKE